MSNYKWKANICCIATYKILEGDDLMDQFEEEDISFEDAKDVKMESLRYFPKTTTNPDIIELIAFEEARKFLKLMVKGYSVNKEKSQTKSSEIIVLLASVFRNKDATIKDLAEKADSLIKFSDE
jgi:hypothetical protein